MMARNRSTGRHRAAPPRLSVPQRLAASALLVTAGAVVTTAWPVAARADAPIQTGWWNEVSGGGQAAPDPAAPSGGLHISAVPGHILAYGAVLYALPSGSSATLELKVSAQGAPNPNPTNTATVTQPAFTIEACPTTHAWQGGDDQAAPGPTYDCTHGFTGSLSADGSTLTFLVDGGGQQTPGQLSLAIVPVLTNAAPVVGTALPVDATEPFTADIAKPDAGSLVVSAGFTTSSPPSGGGFGGTSSSGSSGSTPASSGSTGASTPPNFGSVPPGSTTVTAPTDVGTTPVVAPSNTTSAPAATPAAATTSTDDTGHNVALAMLLLLAISLALAANQRQRDPRMVGQGRHGNSVLVPAPAIAAAAGASAADSAATQPLDAATLASLAGFGARGLGRFSKPRLGPPRPLV